MRSPVVLDVRYIWAFTIYYAIATLWGVSAFYNGLTSIMETGGALVEAVWIAGVMVASMALTILTQTDFAKTEKWFTGIWVAIVSIYPVALGWQYWVEHDTTRGAGSVSSILYLVFPAARWIYLVRKTSKRKV